MRTTSFKSAIRRNLVAAACVLLGVTLAPHTNAQQGDPDTVGSPISVDGFMAPQSIDDRGIDLATRQPIVQTRGITIGVPGQGGLSFNRIYRAKASNPDQRLSRWDHNLTGGVSERNGRFYVKYGSQAAVFFDNSNYSEVQDSGEKLEDIANGRFRFTSRDGTEVIFDDRYRTRNGNEYTFPFDHNRASITDIIRPDGEHISFHYAHAEVQGENYHRLQSITNNYGYQIHLEYETPTSSPGTFKWFNLRKATALNNNVIAQGSRCDPLAPTCAPPGNWPTETYTGHYFAIHTARVGETNAGGNEVTTYSYGNEIFFQLGSNNSIDLTNSNSSPNEQIDDAVSAVLDYDQGGATVSVARVQNEAHRLLAIRFNGSPVDNIEYQYAYQPRSLYSDSGGVAGNPSTDRYFEPDVESMSTGLQINAVTVGGRNWSYDTFHFNGAGEEVEMSSLPRANGGRLYPQTSALVACNDSGTNDNDYKFSDIYFTEITDPESNKRRVRFWRHFDELNGNADQNIDDIVGLRYCTPEAPVGRYALIRDERFRDALQTARTTEYEYFYAEQYNGDANGRLRKIIMPEEDSAEYQYDARGNVTRIFRRPKPGGNNTTNSGSTIEVAATFPEQDSVECSEKKICNKPTSVTDERNFTTNYSYSADHGGLLNVRRPAVNNVGPDLKDGVRPEMRFDYAMFTAYVGSQIFKQIAEAACVSDNFASSPPPPPPPPPPSPNPDPPCTPGYPCAPQDTSMVPSSASTSATDDQCASGHKIITETIYGASDESRLLPIKVTVSSDDPTVDDLKTETTYTARGDVASVDGPIDGTADTTAYQYDYQRRQIGVIGPDPDGNSGLLHRATRTYYHPYGMPERVEQGVMPNQTNGVRSSAFTPLKKVVTDYNPLTAEAVRTKVFDGASAGVLAMTETSYDSRGLVECVAVRMDTEDFNSAETTPNACVQKSSASSPYGFDRITQNTYTSAGELQEIYEAVGTPLQQRRRGIGYTPNGNLKFLRDAKLNETTYEYDGYDRLVKTIFPDKNNGQQPSSSDFVQITSLDAAGNTLEELRRRNGDQQHISYQYDALGRITFRNLPGGEPDNWYCYDNFDRTVYSSIFGNACNNARVTQNTYDGLGRLLEQNQTGIGAVTYGYDEAGLRTFMQWPDNKRVTYDYDATGALTRICGLFTGAQTDCTSNTLIQIAYDDLGRTERWQGADAQRHTVYDYDGASRLTDLSHNGLSGEEVAFGFPSYNPASQILRRTITETTGAGDYLWLPDGDETDIYDPANGLNQYTRINTNIQPTYDPRGNMTNDGANSYVYDAINRLSASPSQGVTLGYDAGDRLWEVDAVSGGGAIRRLLYDGAAMIGEYSNGGTRLLRRYLHGPGVDAPIMCFNGGTAADQRCVPGATSSATDDWFMMLADERGSIVAYVDENRNVVGRNTYGPFGEQGPNNLGTFSYTGQQFIPELGLYHYKARFYNAAYGRFMQTDPIGYEDGMNLYAYTGNDPINLSDPSGTEGIFGFIDFFDFGGDEALARNQQAINDAGFAGANGPGDGARFGPTTGERIVGNTAVTIAESLANNAANVGLVAATLGDPSPAGETLVTVFRVESAVNKRLLINPAGNVTIAGSDNMLFLNFGNLARAEEFLAQRLSQGLDDAVIKSFQVPRSFLDDLRSTAVPQSQKASFPSNPQIVDPTKAADQFGLRQQQIDSLQQVIIPGSGKQL